MEHTTSESRELTDQDVVAHWRHRAGRPGLSRVMRASQPEPINSGVTDRTRAIVAAYLDQAGAALGRRPRTVLEVGCGIGRLTPTIATRADRVTAIDMTPQMLDTARRNCADLSTVDFRLARVEQFPRPAERFDAAVCVWVLMHVLDPERLAAACRTLAAGTRYLTLIEYQQAQIPVSRWSRLRSLEEYLDLMPGARPIARQNLDYGGDRSFAALIEFADQPTEVTA